MRTVLSGATAVSFAICGCATTSSPSASLAASTSSPLAAAIPRSPNTREADYRGQRATSLIGSSILDEEGRVLGTIEDLVVNMRTAAVRYALVAAPDSGKSMLRAVEVKELRSTDMGGYFAVRGLSIVPLVHAGYPADAYPGSRLIGVAIEDPQGRLIGRIADFVVDMALQEVQYAAISFAPHVGLGTERVFAVPLSGLVFAPGSARRLALKARYAELSHLAGFDPAHWPGANDRRFLDAVRQSFTVVFPSATVGVMQ